MKHISSMGPYLSSRKAATSPLLLSPYKSCSSLWNDPTIFILVFSLAWSNSLLLHYFSFPVFFFLLFDVGNDSVCLHAQLSQITAIVRLCCSIRQLQLSEYTCRWENGITGRSMSYPGTLGGAVPISTSGNRVTGWPLYVTSCLGIRERCCTKSEEKLHLFTFRIWCTWSLHKLDAQWRSCLRWFWRKAATAFLLPAHGLEKSPEPAQNAKSDPIWWNIYMQE